VEGCYEDIYKAGFIKCGELFTNLYTLVSPLPSFSLFSFRAVRLLTCATEVHPSNLDRDTDYTNCIQQSAKYTTYILHITATCFGYFNVDIIRLYNNNKKEIVYKKGVMRSQPYNRCYLYTKYMLVYLKGSKCTSKCLL
jgi:hypothetical protein